MPCCPLKIIPFSHQSETTIAYTASLRELYGTHPKIDVWYWDYAALKYVLAGIFTGITLSGYPEITQIKITHGGESSGIIKIGK